ncbi:hypothetical protein HIM_03848 [Hirsutella minnesotensis 3608]|uniref:Uncharacterized protein n=1 Tax=Hirsutella minnesotensis 3608 TaxID=1043627 RepID=A0A0F7ZM42_9HYPO|nr:hypothetical protein HIM_03848 [Hirsutella minnesotensis 3608]
MMTDVSDDPRVNRAPMSVEAGPSRCHMESSFFSIFHSGFAEWAARAEVQNDRLRGNHWTKREPQADSSPSSDGKSRSSRESSSFFATAIRNSPDPSGNMDGAKKFQDSEKRTATSQPAGSRGDEIIVEDEDGEGNEQENSVPLAQSFIPHYSNYASMDAELSILTKHLLQRKSC